MPGIDRSFRRELASTAEGGLSEGEVSSPVATAARECICAVLGLEASRMRGPVLDVGCGYTVTLVSNLSALGVEIRGFDRVLEEETARVRGPAPDDAPLLPYTQNVVRLE